MSFSFKWAIKIQKLSLVAHWYIIMTHIQNLVDNKGSLGILIWLRIRFYQTSRNLYECRIQWRPFMEILQNILRTKIGHTHTFDGFIDHKVCNIISWTIWEYVPNQTWGWKYIQWMQVQLSWKSKLFGRKFQRAKLVAFHCLANSEM